MTDQTTPSQRTGLRDEIARAIHRYDNVHALSGNDIPSEHHRGEAGAVLTVLYREWPWLRAEAEERPSDPELRRQLAAAIESLGKSETENAEFRRRIATLEHVAAGNKRHVQLIVPDLERAEAALARVRTLMGYWVKRTDQLKRAAELLTVVLDEPAPAPSGPAATQATEPHTGLVVQPYRNDRGENVWVFRCWGTDTCDGWLSLDHDSEQSATRVRDRHVAEDHGAPAVDEAVRQPGRPEPDDLITAACPHCEARPPRNRLDDHITTEHADLPPCTAHVPDGIGGRKTCALRVGHKDGEYGDWHVSRVDGPMGRWVWNDGAQGAVPHGAGGPPVQCWHTEADTPCDWDVCNQPERLAAGDHGTDPREQH